MSEDLFDVLGITKPKPTQPNPRPVPKAKPTYMSSKKKKDLEREILTITVTKVKNYILEKAQKKHELDHLVRSGKLRRDMYEELLKKNPKISVDELILLYRMGKEQIMFDRFWAVVLEMITR